MAVSLGSSWRNSPESTPALEDPLDPSLVLPAPPAESLGTLAGEGREFVQEDPHVIGIAVDHVEQLVTQHGQLLRGRAARLGHAVGAGHHLVHHPIVDRGEELLLGADVVVERALAEIVRGAQLRDARGVVPTLGEEAR